MDCLIPINPPAKAQGEYVRYCRTRNTSSSPFSDVTKRRLNLFMGLLPAKENPAKVGGIPMRRFTIAAMCLVVITCFTATTAFAGSAHFVGACTVTQSGSTVSVSGKHARLGDETQIHVVISATALCINGGSNHAKANNN